MAKESVLIIGAGLSGLSAGIFARRAGYAATIFEHHFRPGGLASSWTRGPFTLDGGIHFIGGYKPNSSSYNLLNALGVGSQSLYIPMKDYLTYIDEPLGINLTVGKDLDKLKDDLERIAPKDFAIINDLINGTKAMIKKPSDTLGIEEAPELADELKTIKMQEKTRSVEKFMSNQYSLPISKYAESVKGSSLKDLLINLLTPDVPTWCIFTFLAELANDQMAFVKNGCHEFVSEIEKTYKSLGGDIKYNSQATKILVENGKACGIELKNGQKFMGDYIISAGDGENAIYNLLGGKYTNKEVDTIYKTSKPFRPYLMSTYAVNQEFPNCPVSNHLRLKESIKCGNEEVGDMYFRIMNYGNFAPKGKTMLQAIIETDWNYWSTLRNNKADYKEEKKRLSKELLKRISTYYPGIEEKVELYDIATPHTTKRFTLNKEGSWGGWQTTTEQITRKPIRKLPGLNKFYMAGHWVTTCGVVPSLYSGKHVIDLIQHNL